MSRIYKIKSCGKRHAFCNICRKPRSSLMMLKTPPETGSCKICGSETVVVTAKYCRPCYELSKLGSPHPQKGHKLSQETKDKIGFANTQAHKKHIQECDGSCGSAWCGNSKYTMTKIHVILSEFLVNAGYEVILEKRFGRFSVDCFVSELNMAFEADGIYWHSHPDKIKSDKKRDKEIFKKFGVKVIRFSEIEIMEFKN